MRPAGHGSRGRAGERLDPESGSRPGVAISAAERRPSQLVVLEPVHLEVIATLDLPEPSIARLSADRADVYAVGNTSLLRVYWDGTGLRLDDEFRVTYRTIEGQTYGWDCVVSGGDAWFFDDGDRSERFAGTLLGQGMSWSSTLSLEANWVDTGSPIQSVLFPTPGFGSDLHVCSLTTVSRLSVVSG